MRPIVLPAESLRLDVSGLLSLSNNVGKGLQRGRLKCYRQIHRGEIMPGQTRRSRVL